MDHRLLNIPYTYLCLEERLLLGYLGVKLDVGETDHINPFRRLMVRE